MNQITPTGYAQSGKWVGTPVEGSRFTEQQLIGLEQRSLPATVEVRVVRLKVPRARTTADIQSGRPQEDCYDIREVECPVVGRTRQGDRVLTPGGDVHSLPVQRGAR